MKGMATLFELGKTINIIVLLKAYVLSKSAPLI